MSPGAEPDLDLMFQALADRHRRAMVDRLALGPASVKELAGPMALPSAVKHLAVLERGGLVASAKAGRVRTYRLRDASLVAMERWAANHRRALGAAFDRLEALMREDDA